MSNIQENMETAMSKIKDMIDVNTIIGNPITTPDGTTLIPVSKVAFGFGSGGTDGNNMRFGAGVGAGVVGASVGAGAAVSGAAVGSVGVLSPALLPQAARPRSSASIIKASAHRLMPAHTLKRS